MLRNFNIDGLFNSLQIATKFETKLSKASRKLDFKLGRSLLRNNKNCEIMKPSKNVAFLTIFFFTNFGVFCCFINCEGNILPNKMLNTESDGY